MLMFYSMAQQMQFGIFADKKKNEGIKFPSFFFPYMRLILPYI